MLSDLIVYLIVAIAIAYAGWKFTPLALRSRLAPGLARHLERLGVSSENARRLESKLTTAGACGSCNECNACATDPGQGSALEESSEQALSSSLYPVIPIRIDKREY